MCNDRFSQLIQLAKDGDESAVASLWWEFEFDFHAEVLPSSETRHSTPDTLEGGM